MTRNRRADWRRIKTKYSYTIDEAARTLNVHTNTVRHWARRGGLPLMDGTRPHLILGAALVDFLKSKRIALKRKCGPGEMYCLKCRAPRGADANKIEQCRMPPGRTRIVSCCSTCGTAMHRFVADRELSAVLLRMGVHTEIGDGSLTDSPPLHLSCHSAASETV